MRSLRGSAMQEEIQRLLSEIQRAKFTERRSEPRHPFVRPVRIYQKRDQVTIAFSKDMSAQGIGVISDVQWTPGTIADLWIHSTSGHPVCMRCEVRWTDNYGRGWFLTGWKFLSTVACPPGV
ncbi:MAG: PilZ domain-containing protein [Planctomycetaceae bacterium]|nr:PilZ domain-containing protein [Planctomycetaceae bacterium]